MAPDRASTGVCCRPWVARSTVQVTIDPRREQGTFVVGRRFNGQSLESRRVVDRETTYQLLSSFRLPLFDRSQLDADGTYELSIRAVVSGGEAREMTTMTLAKADLVLSPPPCD